jgi:hypothetical protein
MFHVLLGTSADVPLASIAETLAAFHKIPFQDAAHDARVGWGFVGRNMPEAEAQQLAALLESKNIRACVMSSDAILPIPLAKRVKALEWESGQLHLTLADGSKDALASSNVRAIAALGLPTRSVTTEKIVEGPSNVEKLVNVGLLLSGIPISIGKKKRVVEKTTVKEDLLFYVDILADSPPRRFRIDAQNLNYAFLKQRMLHNTLQNFKMLLGDLAAWAPTAHLNRGTRFLTKNMILSQMGYESFNELELETLWLSALPR